MPTFSSIQAMKGWTEIANPSIDPAVPSSYSLTQGVQWVPKGLLLEGVGVAGKYSGWAAKSPALTLPATFTSGQLSTIIAVDSNFAANGQALELGFKPTDAEGYTYNLQINLDGSKSATELTIEVVNKSGGWSPIATIPKFAANALTPCGINAAFDLAAKTSSVTSVVVNGTAYPVPADLQNLPAAQLGWGKSAAIVQLQQDFKPEETGWQAMFYDLALTMA